MNEDLSFRKAAKHGANLRFAVSGPCYTSGADADPTSCGRNPEDFREGKVELGATSHIPTPQLSRAGRALEAARPAMLSPYIVEVEVNCDECGGSGFDPGGIDPWGPEPCPVCHGAKTQRITRNYLGEALRIAANPACQVPVERAHLVAIVQYCRQAVSAVVSLPEVPVLAQTQVHNESSSRHRRGRSKPHKAAQIERRKRNVDISPQRARS